MMSEFERRAIAKKHGDSEHFVLWRGENKHGQECEAHHFASASGVEELALYVRYPDGWHEVAEKGLGQEFTVGMGLGMFLLCLGVARDWEDAYAKAYAHLARQAIGSLESLAREAGAIA